MNCSYTDCRLKHCHAVDSPGVATHRINHIAICFLNQTGIGPAKRECDRDIYSRRIHLSNEIFGARYTYLRISIECIEPGIAFTIALAIFANIWRKEMRMKVNKHIYILLLCMRATSIMLFTYSSRFMHACIAQKHKRRIICAPTETHYYLNFAKTKPTVSKSS